METVVFGYKGNVLKTTNLIKREYYLTRDTLN
jgi:hypothetical protein